MYIKWEVDFLKNNPKFVESIINFPNSPILEQTEQKSISPLSTLSIGSLNFEIKPEFYFTALGKAMSEFYINVYGNIVRKGLKESFIKTLKSIDENVNDVDIIQIAGVPCIGIRMGNNYFPIDTMGEGFSKIFSIIAIMIDKQNGVLLIDEIENGIYWKVQGSFWKYLEMFAKKFNVQIFATTHSYEFLKNAINNISEPKIVSGIKIKRKKESFEANVLKGNELFEMLEDSYEVR